MRRVEKISPERLSQFLEGHNPKKYVVKVETYYDHNYAHVIVHPPNEKPRPEKIIFEPFVWLKDLSENGIQLYGGDEDLKKDMMEEYGITETLLETGKVPRLDNGYKYKISSNISSNAITQYLKRGGLDMWKKDEQATKEKEQNVYVYSNLKYSVSLEDQFFIYTGIRLFKGFEKYSEVPKVTFDIETTGLKYQNSRIFQIGIRDNVNNFEEVLEVDKKNDDNSEKNLIKKFFFTLTYLKTAIIAGYNSEEFDFNFIIGRAKRLGLDLQTIQTTLNQNIEQNVIHKKKANLKVGGTSDKFLATRGWGYNYIDILHAARRTKAQNSDMENARLKYVCKFEDIAKPNRMYVEGDKIYDIWSKNKTFVIKPETNEYHLIPDDLQEEATNELKILKEESSRIESSSISENLYDWIKNNTEFIDQGYEFTFISGGDIVRRYLLDDLWETEQVDNLYNQSSFLVSKILPTSYSRVTTMGTASVWSLLMTTWSFENNLAIPVENEKWKFSGGLARCFKSGYSINLKKIDYASLYPMLELTYDIFPNCDITGVLRETLKYLTTERNKYKAFANDNSLNDDDRNFYKVKQLPLKILNNSLFGALGTPFGFNWGDMLCAARITCSGRLQLRHLVSWFKKYGVEAVLMVTDGVNFKIPETTNVDIDGNPLSHEMSIDDVWEFTNSKDQMSIGIDALIDKFNDEEMPKPYMAVDDDGTFESCVNFGRIVYALRQYDKKKDKFKIKKTGNSIKSSTMPEYIKEFFDKGLEMILEGKGKEFVESYYDELSDIYYRRIPLGKIATKRKYKETIKDYLNRGNDKNGRPKAKKAHMELMIQKRNKIAEDLYEKYYGEDNNIPIEEKMEYEKVKDSMPPEPEIDSILYFVNIGKVKSHGDSKIIIDKETGKEKICSILIDEADLENNAEHIEEYNVSRYVGSFNEKVISILSPFKPELRDKKNGIIITNPEDRKYYTDKELELGAYDDDTYEEAMTLEDKEVEFWNATGLDPRKVYDGFNENEDHPLYLSIYDEKLECANQMLKDKGINLIIKSINDDYQKGDYVLLKEFERYDLCQYNGIYLEVHKPELDLPKTKTEKIVEEKIRQKKLSIIKYAEELIAHEIEIEEQIQRYIDTIDDTVKETMKKREIKKLRSQDSIILPEKMDRAEVELAAQYIVKLRQLIKKDVTWKVSDDPNGEILYDKFVRIERKKEEERILNEKDELLITDEGFSFYEP